jgi:type II secretory pathway pseudopilin PulG
MRKHLFGIIVFLATTASLAAVVVPNLRVALNRSKEKRTMAGMRAIATAWEARANDRNAYTIGVDRGVVAARDASDFAKLHRVSYEELRAALEPKYIPMLPRTDGWGHDYELATGDYDANGEAQLYAIRSRGHGIVYSNGSFLQSPEGM